MAGLLGMEKNSIELQLIITDLNSGVRFLSTRERVKLVKNTKSLKKKLPLEKEIKETNKKKIGGAKAKKVQGNNLCWEINLGVSTDFLDFQQKTGNG
ncbi:hypothetical protein J6590_050471 [Homalodisca vitripennis]|nr:hypothetical protein J6590_050471 [Homalodisca vitripennis]